MQAPPLPAGAKTLPKAITPPIDVSRFKSEKHVKGKIRQILDHYGWFAWMPPANGYGMLGVHDFNAIKDGAFLTIEAKWNGNKPTPAQKAFAGHMMANTAFAFCVDEKNIDHLVWWLDSFEVLRWHEVNKAPLPDEHGARCMNAQYVLTRGWE